MGGRGSLVTQRLVAQDLSLSSSQPMIGSMAVSHVRKLSTGADGIIG